MGPGATANFELGWVPFQPAVVNPCLLDRYYPSMNRVAKGMSAESSLSGFGWKWIPDQEAPAVFPSNGREAAPQCISRLAPATFQPDFFCNEK